MDPFLIRESKLNIENSIFSFMMGEMISHTQQLGAVYMRAGTRDQTTISDNYSHFFIYLLHLHEDVFHLVPVRRDPACAGSRILVHEFTAASEKSYQQ